MRGRQPVTGSTVAGLWALVISAIAFTLGTAQEVFVFEFRNDSGITAILAHASTSPTATNNMLSALESRLEELAPAGSGRISVLTVSPVRQCFVRVGSPTEPALSQLVAAVATQFTFTYVGNTATALAPADLTSSNADDSGPGTMLLVVYSILGFLAALLLLIIFYRKVKLYRMRTIADRSAYGRPLLKRDTNATSTDIELVVTSMSSVTRKTQHRKKSNLGALDWEDDIGGSQEASEDRIADLYPVGQPLPAGKRTFYGGGGRLAAAMTPAGELAARADNLKVISREHESVLRESERAERLRLGLQKIDDFMRKRGIALSRGDLSWDDVWEARASLVVVLPAEDEKCAPHIPSEELSVHSGPVVATSLGAYTVSSSVLCTRVSLFSAITQSEREVWVLQPNAWGAKARVSVMVELLFAAKETLRSHAQASGSIFIHESHQQSGPSGGSFALAWISLQCCLFTGYVNLPHTAAVIRAKSGAHFEHLRDFSMVYSCLKYTLICTPQFNMITGRTSFFPNKTAVLMYDAIMAWIQYVKKIRSSSSEQVENDFDDANVFNSTAMAGDTNDSRIEEDSTPIPADFGNDFDEFGIEEEAYDDDFDQILAEETRAVYGSEETDTATTISYGVVNPTFEVPVENPDDEDGFTKAFSENESDDSQSGFEPAVDAAAEVLVEPRCEDVILEKREEVFTEKRESVTEEVKRKQVLHEEEDSKDFETFKKMREEEKRAAADAKKREEILKLEQEERERAAAEAAAAEEGARRAKEEARAAAEADAENERLRRQAKMMDSKNALLRAAETEANDPFLTFQDQKQQREKEIQEENRLRDELAERNAHDEKQLMQEKAAEEVLMAENAARDAKLKEAEERKQEVRENLRRKRRNSAELFTKASEE